MSDREIPVSTGPDANGETMSATFDANDHCTHSGWARHLRRKTRRRLRCVLLGCAWHPSGDGALNGHSPASYRHCPRCHRAEKFYVLGQHRYGGMDKARA